MKTKVFNIGKILPDNLAGLEDIDEEYLWIIVYLEQDLKGWALAFDRHKNLIIFRIGEDPYGNPLDTIFLGYGDIISLDRLLSENYPNTLKSKATELLKLS